MIESAYTSSNSFYRLNQLASHYKKDDKSQ